MENRNSWTLSLAIFYLIVALAIQAHLAANLLINKLEYETHEKHGGGIV